MQASGSGRNRRFSFWEPPLLLNTAAGLCSNSKLLFPTPNIFCTFFLTFSDHMKRSVSSSVIERVRQWPWSFLVPSDAPQRAPFQTPELPCSPAAGERALGRGARRVPCGPRTVPGCRGRQEKELRSAHRATENANSVGRRTYLSARCMYFGGLLKTQT